jgi:hypothetical protein
LLFYYQWLDNPQPAHAETVGIKLFGEFFEHGNIFSLNLYDTRNGGTYYAEDVSRNEDFLNRHTAKKFKLINQNEANNYRGFLSFSVKYRSDSLIKQNVFYYIRQRTVLNHKGSDILYLYDNAFDGAFPFDFSFDSAFSSYSYNEPLIVFNENWLINVYTFWANVEW